MELLSVSLKTILFLGHALAPGKFRVRSRSVPARRSKEAWKMIKTHFFRWIFQDASYITRMNMVQAIVLAAVLMVSWGTLKDSVMFGWFWVGWWCWWCWWCSWCVGDVLVLLMHFPNEKINATGFIYQNSPDSRREWLRVVLPASVKA